jgi:6-pyruvoyltetrahydropterin/6-carboxytetrahydropterin synthase
VIRVTRRYRFAASHRLHSESFSEEENREIFGKCNNPYGHGHDYEIFVTARGPVDERTGRAFNPAELDTLVDREIVSAFQHKNMNVDIPAFAQTVPTTENLAIELGRRLTKAWSGSFPGEWPVLEKIRIRETDRNIFELTMNP